MITERNHSTNVVVVVIDEENKNQIAEQLRSNRIANNPGLHYRYVDR